MSSASSSKPTLAPENPPPSTERPASPDASRGGPAYRRLRIKVDAQLAAQQTQEAADTLRTILRLQHLSQIK